MNLLNVRDFFAIAGFGLVATTAMTMVLYAMRWAQVVHTDVIQTVGSMFAHGRSRFTKFGLGAHFLFGVLFAFVYAGVINAVRLHQPFPVFLACLFVANLHALVAGYAIVIFVAENQKGRVRESGMTVAAVDWVSHLVYGAVLGGLFAWYIGSAA